MASFVEWFNEGFQSAKILAEMLSDQLAPAIEMVA
jgi:hypothetical protein